MDIRQLQFLVALGETQHFGKAAALCSVTQPTLSSRLHNLEDELGIQLVARNHRFQGFTSEGERILAWAKSILAACDGLQAEAASCRGALVGRLRIGTVPLASVEPTDIIDTLSKQYNALQFSLQTYSSEHIANALHRNELDLGLCYLEGMNTQHFNILPFKATPMVLVYSPNHFSFKQNTVSWQALSVLPLGLLTPSMHFRQSIVLNMANVGVNNEPVIESDSVHCLLQAVQKGICCTIVPMNVAMANASSSLAHVVVEDSKTISKLGLIMRKGEPESPIAKQCFEFLKGVV
ncbi:LysR family transcriptional regulator [Alteromonas sp. ALT199]|uniref:LysR family transcriptional regulator n=1 Tax=unclassified Alteromonas TaxID=2614992 RepID=UPI001BE5F0E1|nr:LysR family transcriptional regulator [Alteromonas sp. ALT199]MBT3137172.1 LysR family transcriptional regulator [Alteromonas sp. ALT199]